MIFETVAIGAFLGALALAAVMSSKPLTARRACWAMALGWPACTVGALAALFLRGLL